MLTTATIAADPAGHRSQPEPVAISTIRKIAAMASQTQKGLANTKASTASMAQAPADGEAGAAGRLVARALACSPCAALTSSVMPAIDPAIEAMSVGTITVLVWGELASLPNASTYFWATK